MEWINELLDSGYDVGVLLLQLIDGILSTVFVGTERGEVTKIPGKQKENVGREELQKLVDEGALTPDQMEMLLKGKQVGVDVNR